MKITLEVEIDTSSIDSPLLTQQRLESAAKMGITVHLQQAWYEKVRTQLGYMPIRPETTAHAKRVNQAVRVTSTSFAL